MKILTDNFDNFCQNKSFAHVTDDEVAALCAMLNNKPRKSRNWKTPYELFHQHLNVAFQT
ncbi:MAG: hypothetical protein WBK20_14120 [Spirochaetota bacterium]